MHERRIGVGFFGGVINCLFSVKIIGGSSLGVILKGFQLIRAAGQPIMAVISSEFQRSVLVDLDVVIHAHRMI
jgi:hypothetical protein